MHVARPVLVLVLALEFAAEADLVQVFVAVLVELVGVVAAGEPIRAVETFERQDVEHVLGRQVERYVGTALYLGHDHGQVGVRQVDVRLVR